MEDSNKVSNITEYNVGRGVRCFDNQGIPFRLTVGSVYRIVRGWDTLCLIGVIDDTGLYGQYHFNRFELI